MKLFKYYRLSFALSFAILALGSIFKVTHTEFQFLNGTNTIVFGLVSMIVCIALAYTLIYKSRRMPAGEKLIWVICFALGFLVNVGLISFATAVLFFFIGNKRL